MSENNDLKKTMSHQYVPVKTHEDIKTALSSTLDKTNRELVDVKKKCEDINQEFVKIKGENEILKRNLENTQNQVKAEYISLREHEEKMSGLRKSMKKVQDNSAEILANYRKARRRLSPCMRRLQPRRENSTRYRNASS